MNKLMIIAGEASGDLHGGHVIHELNQIRSDFHYFGTGGDRLKKEGVKLHYHAKDLAVIGIWEVVKNWGYYKGIFNEMVSLLDTEKPDAVFLVDYAGFNLRFAEQARKRGIKVILFIAPQVWAWKKNRVFKIKKFIDELIVIFPFEVDFFNGYKIKSSFFGHPLLDIVKTSMDKEAVFKKWDLDMRKKLVCLAPGSRRIEIQRHLPVLLEMASILHHRNPEYQFAFSMAPTIDIKFVAAYLRNSKVPVKIIKNDTYNIVGHGDISAVSAGTATLETAILQTPMVIHYRTSKITYLIGKYLLGIHVIGLPNIVSKALIVPELIQSDFTAKKMANQIEEILNNHTLYNNIKTSLRALKDKLGTSGSYKKTAQFLSETLTTDYGF